MFDWRSVWDAKGRLDTNDLTLISGHERASLDTAMLHAVIKESLNLTKKSTVLEVGSAAGLLRTGLDCDYVGVDYSFEICQKFRTFFGDPILQAEAAFLPFAAKSFDVSFSFSVYHYFRDFNYAFQALWELCRVSKFGVFIGDLPFSESRPESSHFF